MPDQQAGQQVLTFTTKYILFRSHTTDPTHSIRKSSFHLLEIYKKFTFLKQKSPVCQTGDFCFIIVNVKINLTFTIIILFILPCTSDDCLISVQIGTGKRNLFIAFTIFRVFHFILLCSLLSSDLSGMIM